MVQYLLFLKSVHQTGCQKAYFIINDFAIKSIRRLVRFNLNFVSINIKCIINVCELIIKLVTKAILHEYFRNNNKNINVGIQSNY